MAPSAKAVLPVLLVGLVVGAGVTAVLGVGPGGQPGSSPADEPAVEDGLTTFENASEYGEYVDADDSHYVGGFGGGVVGVTSPEMDVEVTLDSSGTVARNAAASGDAGSGGTRARIGGANVQEQGIDEPDLVAAVGDHFVYSPDGPQRYVPVPDRLEEKPKPRPPTGTATVINASEPTDPALAAEINASGTLLRSNDTLVVLGGRQVTGYDVSDPDDPAKVWTKSLNSSIETARMTGGQLYVVTRTSANRACPIEPMGKSEIACTDIHRPQVRIDADATFTAYSIDPARGTVADSTSFVGTARSTVVYMSADALYVTYTEDTRRTEIAVDYLVEEAEVVPQDVRERIRQIDSYDISVQAKRIEMRRAVRGWLDSLPAEERKAARQALSTGLKNYAAQRQRQLSTTGIVRIGVGGGDLSVDATETVPGRPLNQFSMDQHAGTLRIATTIPGMYGAQSVNDVYTLEATSLERLGAATGMGEGQRIYAVRYVGDTAYMVTFRQVDPLHVVDLSDPRNPRELGNVKLPGFSNYLHPVGEDTILGIGEQDGQVKAVLFDVSDPTNPSVADSTVLDAHWSAVSRTHHAFMQDPRHGVAFLPAGERGIVLDYTNGSLSVEKRLALEAAPERARYVGDSLYVFSPAEIAVYDESTWDEVATLELDG